jgi:hypothetical protein
MRRKTFLHLESLEDRVLLNGQTDFLINTTLPGNHLDPGVAADGQGNFVVAWDGFNPANGTTDIFAQRYHADGSPNGGEFVVNTTTAGTQQFPKVAADAAGDFVVVWTGPNPATGKTDIWGRRFDSNGNPVTPTDVLLDPTTEGLDSGARVAMSGDGTLVAVSRTGLVNGARDIYAELYNGSLNPLGSAFRVNQVHTGAVTNSKLAMDSSGNLVVTWGTLASNGLLAVNGRRFDNQGNALTNDFPISGTPTGGNDTNLALAVAPDGGFLAAWDAVNSTTHNLEVHALRFSAAGQPGTPFLVSAPTTSADLAAVAFDASGNSTIAWQTQGTGSPVPDTVYAQRYDSSGNPSGAVSQLNVQPASDLSSVVLAEAPGGTSLAAWPSLNTDNTTAIHGTLSVVAQPPVLTSLTGTTTGNEGDTFSFQAAATDPNGDPLTYSWDLNGDGVFGDAPGPDVSAVFTDVGQHNVSVMVTDSLGLSTVGSLAVTVVNVPPTPTLGLPITIDEGNTVPFSAGLSDPGQGTETYSYSWDFNYDGQTFNAQASGPTPQDTFIHPGTFVVAVQVIDSNGGLGLATTTVTVRPDSPTVSAGPDQTAVEGTPVTLSGSWTDPDASLDTFQESWAVTQGGTTVATGTGPSLTFTPGDSGTYLATFTVSEADGSSGSSTATIAVADAPLSASAVAVSAVEGQGTGAVTVATFTDANPNAAAGDFSATISWGDGSTSAGTIAADGSGGFVVTGSHTYAEDGSFPVGLTVTDVGGSTATVAGSATVADAPLQATASLPEPVAGVPFTAAMATFTDGDVTAPVSDYSATITWGDGTSTAGTIKANGQGGYTVSATKTYQAPGSFAFSVQIADVGGSTVTVGGNVTVTSPAQPIRPGDTASAGFWRGWPGQVLIRFFNGGPASTRLGYWLAATFPNLYGAAAGAHNLAGKTNAQVADFYRGLFDSRQRLPAQVLATALNEYATTLSLGGTVGELFGFQVTAGGLGVCSFDVGKHGAPFGVANNTNLTVAQLLAAVDQQAVDGVPWGNNPALQWQANAAFDDLNEAGEAGGWWGNLLGWFFGGWH